MGELGVPRLNGLTISVLQTLETGVPFGPNNINNANPNGVDARPVRHEPGLPDAARWRDHRVLLPGRLLERAGLVTAAGFGCTDGAQRDAFRTDGQKRTDLAINYVFRMATGGRSLEFFTRADVLNLFDQSQMCGCGGTVFQPEATAAA